MAERRPEPAHSPRASNGRANGPRLRGRPKVISNDELLQVARGVFLERGIRATTAEVAERAGIAEGTVFMRFKSKDALFRAAMCIDPNKLPPFVEALSGRVGKGDLRRTLVEFATSALEVSRHALPVMLMSWSNPGGEYALEKATERSEGYRRGFSAVRRFFEGEMRAGRLGPCNAELLTRIFMGSLHHYCLSELFLAQEEGKRLSPTAFAEGLVDMLLRATPRPKAVGKTRSSATDSGARATGTSERRRAPRSSSHT